jgi:hypothetical protein
MKAKFNSINRHNAFFRTLAHTGLSAFETDGEQYLPDKVLVTIPAIMQNEFPQNLLQSAIYICNKTPFLWNVQDTLPNITDTTTFQELFDNWFKRILS